LEDSGVDFYFIDAGAEEFFEGRDDTGFFAGARGAVDEEVWKVAALGLWRCEFGGEGGGERECVLESGDVRRGLCGRLVDRGIWGGVYRRGGPWR